MPFGADEERQGLKGSAEMALPTSGLTTKNGIARNTVRAWLKAWPDRRPWLGAHGFRYGSQRVQSNLAEHRYLLSQIFWRGRAIVAALLSFCLACSWLRLTGIDP